MNEMTLSSRHRIRNSRPCCLRPETLPLGHGGSPQYRGLDVDGEETFLWVLQTDETGNRTPNSSVKGSGANHFPTHLFIGENGVFHSDCTIVYAVLVVSFYVLYYCIYYLLIPRLN